MEKVRFIVAASALAVVGAFAAGSAQAEILGGADAVRAAAAIGAVVEPVQFRFGGYDYCWYEGWNGPGWYWCGYANRVGLGWGGPIGWNNWRRVYRDRDDFRFHDHDRFRDRDFHDHDHDRR